MGKTYEFEPQKFYYTFGPHEAALRIAPGDTVHTWTVDSGSLDVEGKEIPRERRHLDPATVLFEANPLTGPFYVEGARPGDMLAVRIDRIAISRSFAISKFNPGFGSLAPETRGMGPTGLSEPLPARVFRWELDLERNVGALDLPESERKRVEIPLHPFFGCIGVAPQYGEINTALTPAENGGNMDCVETREGTTVYLPVFVEGGLAFVGDVHAAQGDGEICGVGLETTADVTLHFDLVKEKPIRWPRLEDDEWIMVAASTRPLIDAYRIAHAEMVGWLASDYGFDRWEAFQLLSQVGRARVGNVVDPKYTVVSKFPKAYIS